MLEPLEAGLLFDATFRRFAIRHGLLSEEDFEQPEGRIVAMRRAFRLSSPLCGGGQFVVRMQYARIRADRNGAQPS